MKNGKISNEELTPGFEQVIAFYGLRFMFLVSHLPLLGRF